MHVSGAEEDSRRCLLTLKEKHVDTAMCLHREKYMWTYILEYKYSISTHKKNQAPHEAFAAAPVFQRSREIPRDSKSAAHDKSPGDHTKRELRRTAQHVSLCL